MSRLTLIYTGMKRQEHFFINVPNYIIIIYIYIYRCNYYHHWLIGQVGRVFANDRVIPKTLKMVLDTSLLIIQQYKVHIKGKVEKPRERSSALSYTSM